MTDVRPFRPDWVSAPGDTIADLLEERGWAQADLALRTGFTKKHVNDLVRGRAAISADTAERLATVLGSTSEFWLTREAKYRAGLERQRTLESRKADVSWLAELPVAWMTKRGLIPPVKQKAARVDELLRWFGVANVDAWRTTYAAPLVAFRAAAKLDGRVGGVATWLRAAEIEADAIPCKPFELDAFRTALGEVRRLVVERDPRVFLPKVRAYCANAGVAVVWTPAPPRCAVHGATRWLTATKALLVLSARYRSDDQLWFSFFHEAAHIVKHGKKLLFIEGLAGLDAEKEEEANRFAAETLIPARSAASLSELTTEAQVIAYAEAASIAPGVVVGRLQHDGHLTHAQMNHLKVRYEWAHDSS